jgi:ABC-type Fe3+/spermidine/putrescine transport system ATPase subunit
MSPPPVDRTASSVAPLVRVQGMTRSFGGVRALRGVGLEVRSGEVHALLGENGAGKSTLIKILSGVHSFDSGTIEIEGAPVAFDSPTDSRKAGIAVVYQDLSLVESLSVDANLMLNREPTTRFGFVKKRQLMAEAEDFLKQHKIPLDSRATVGSLPFAYRQMTEICKALMGRVRRTRVSTLAQTLSRSEWPWMLYLAFLVLLVIFSFASPWFLSIDNFLKIGRQTTLVSIAAIGMTFVIIAGQIDLSVASTLALSGMTAALAMSHLANFWFVGALAGLGTGAGRPPQ